MTSRLPRNLAQPELFRSYYTRSDGTTCKIWEAIRATTAFPLLFEHISIGPSRYEKVAYTGGDLLESNPIKLLVNERNSLYEIHDTIPAPHGCIVSLGTGKPEVISLVDYRIGDVNAEEKLFNALEKMATNCETAHQEFGNDAPLGMEEIYFRFNVEQGLQNIADSDWKSDDDIITTHTREYVTSSHIHHPSISTSTYLTNLLIDI